MLVVGLTGSVGMGKSTVLKHLAESGVAVLDADSVVHDLYRGAAVDPIRELFPEVVTDGVVDRARLSRVLVGDPSGFVKLEAIVHPLVREAQRQFLLRAERAGERIAVLEIPLLYETGGEERVDVIVVVSAPAAIQRERVLARPGMTEDKFETILARQVSDAEKRARADFVVDTGLPLEETFAQINDIVAQLRLREGTVMSSLRT